MHRSDRFREWRERAQQWHEQHCDKAARWYSSCFCCCGPCDPREEPPGNPHWFEEDEE